MGNWIANFIGKIKTKHIYGHNKLPTNRQVTDMARDVCPTIEQEYCPHCEADTKHFHNKERGWVCMSCNLTGSESADGCFISTAICQTRGLPDDCYELNVLRGFRDNHLAQSENGRKLIKRYYEIAPEIVEAIGRLPQGEALYDELNQKYLVQIICHIESNNHQEAINIYMRMIKHALSMTAMQSS